MLGRQPKPPEGWPPAEEHNKDEFAEGIAQRAIATREQVGDQLLPWFIQRIDESVQKFDKVGPDQWDISCYLPPGPEPVRTLLDMRIVELSMPNLAPISSRHVPTGSPLTTR